MFGKYIAACSLVGRRLSAPRAIATMDTAVMPPDILRFWFGTEWFDGGFDAPEYAKRRARFWFMGGADVDAQCREFIPCIRAAGRGQLAGAEWSTRDGLVSQLVLLDQFARNAFRGEGEAFAYDARAISVALRLIEQAGAAPSSVPWPAALFIATCLMHSEDLAQHARVTAFCEAHVAVSQAPLIIGQLQKDIPEHTAVIRRFGRYPHRNAAYGRTTTANEAAWLASEEAPRWSKSQQSMTGGNVKNK